MDEVTKGAIAIATQALAKAIEEALDESGIPQTKKREIMMRIALKSLDRSKELISSNEAN